MSREQKDQVRTVQVRSQERSSQNMSNFLDHNCNDQTNFFDQKGCCSQNSFRLYLEQKMSQIVEQAGAVLGQAQLKLELDFPFLLIYFIELINKQD